MSLSEKFYFLRSRDERARIAGGLSFEKDREFLFRILEKDPDAKIREKVLDKLPYPEARNAVRSAAKNDPDERVRYYAVLKLKYPEDRDLPAPSRQTDR